MIIKNRPKDTIILLGTDSPIGLSIIRDLGQNNYNIIGIGYSKTSLGSHSKYCTYHVVREEKEADLIQQIIDLSKEYKASFLMSVSENDLILLNKYRKTLETHISLLIPDSGSLKNVLDKNICQNHAQAVGIQIPKNWQFSSLKEIKEHLKKLPYPVVIKWADPNAVNDLLFKAGLEFIKTAYAQTADELLNILTPYDKIKQFPMVQEYCPGHGLGQFFLVRNGEIIIEFQHERLHEWPPEGGTSTLCQSVSLKEHQEIRTKSHDLLKRLNWNGVAMVEYRYDVNSSNYYFMEINGRFWGSLPLATSAKIPFASGLVAVCGLHKNPPIFNENYKIITACYWIPETRRLVRLLFQRNKIADPFYKTDALKSLWLYLTLPFRLSNSYFVFKFSDSMPFFGDLANISRKVKKQLFKR